MEEDPAFQGAIGCQRCPPSAAGGVEVPTLLVYGDRDERAPLSIAHARHAAIASSRLVVLEGVGHVCNLEAPVEFNRAVTAFLADQHAR